MRPWMLAFVIALFLHGHAAAEPWPTADPKAAGWSMPKLAAVEEASKALKPAAFLIVQDGKAIASWGDVTAKINVASVRKSLLSALYGIAVSKGRIDLSKSLASLGIDDKAPALTDTEKTATVRDLLMARSGIYHPAAHETKAIKRKRPERGSHAPGSFWFYNNWDFNALGTIYRQLTGEDIFQSFGTRIARPLGMEDFSPADGRYATEAASEHPAYPFRLSARDAARFGQLYLNGGSWAGKQIVPAAWVKESTTAYSWTKRGRQGYGYMWWVLSPEEWGPNAAYAAGFGGQVIAYVPSKKLVVVQMVDLKQTPEGIKTSDFLKLLKQIAAAAP
ncbi:serine hydrolase domain-containing protein [Mesorhizobium sp. NPDC059054]|uniref:serine hydrolase domain-containing protein n=1 Tax=Mesorhizobium sp. NPDC059054 TaxID=3346711 RepID=UPI003673906C